MAILGDIHRRTGEKDDFVETNQSQHDFSTTEEIEFMSIDDIQSRSIAVIHKHRSSNDKMTNENGRELLKLCCNNNLFIVNGRIGTMPDCKFTCHTARGESVVDYFIVDPIMLSTITCFKVNDEKPLSDHSCVCVHFTYSALLQSDSKAQTKQTFYRWNAEIKKQYSLAINGPDTQEKFIDIINDIHKIESDTELDSIVDSINTFILDVANPYTTISLNKQGQPHKMNRAKWYDQDCIQQRMVYNGSRKAYAIVNIKKSNVMRISRKALRKLPVISYSDSSLEWVDSYKYLGVIFTKSKSFTKYLKLVCQKAGISQTVLDVHTSKHSSVSINHIFNFLTC